MWWIAIVLSVILLLVGVYLFCAAPGKRKVAFSPFEQVYIAHRGLFDNTRSYPENSLPAFRRAVEQGYGIELDVQLTKDGQLVVFHDETLQRMCGIDKKVRECTFDELQHCFLASSQETIPLFTQVLSEINSQVPLVVEIKMEGNWKQTTLDTLGVLEPYKGIFCVESFHPGVLRMVKQRRPDIIRGQLSTNSFRDNPHLPFVTKFMHSYLLMNFISRPDFVAYNHVYTNHLFYRLYRRVFGGRHAAWTVTDQKTLRQAKQVYNCIIFDSFLP